MGAANPVDIRNWQRRDNNLTTSGRLLPSDPARLAAIGVRNVVNLALDDHPEALANEANLLAAHGIRYVHMPVPFDAPTLAHFEELKTVLSAVDGPTHVHCIMNFRVSAFLYLRERQIGVPHGEAHARMAEIWDPLTSEWPPAAPWRALIEPFV